ncbi:MAG: 50S ribosomal protein L15 [Deltaproteobacteria bacterium]|nr:50S ribosomal protein L15 [Deltaproteobacteria bacterium]
MADTIKVTLVRSGIGRNKKIRETLRGLGLIKLNKTVELKNTGAIRGMINMKIHELSPAEGSRKKGKRVGRGPGSGHGKTSCRGHKGQKSRSGGGPRPGFEGGQMPLHRRLPKRGFNNIFKKYYSIINIKDLNRFAPNSNVDSEALRKAGLVGKAGDSIKLLGNGEISHPVVIQVHKVSKAAKEKIEASGGKVEVI